MRFGFMRFWIVFLIILVLLGVFVSAQPEFENHGVAGDAFVNGSGSDVGAHGAGHAEGHKEIPLPYYVGFLALLLFFMIWYALRIIFRSY